MKKIGMLFALLAGALLAAHAQAQAPGQFYVGVGGGAMWSNGASPYTNTSDEKKTSGGKIYAGAMAESWGLELAAYHLGNYAVQFNNVTIAESEPRAIVVSAVYVTDIGGGYTFHAKGGIAFTRHTYTCVSSCGTGSPVNANTETDNLSGMWALGFGARLTQNIEARMDWEHIGSFHHAVSTTAYKESVDMFTVSLQFGF